MLRKILAIILLFLTGPAFAMMKPGMRAPDFTIEAAQGEGISIYAQRSAEERAGCFIFLS